MTRQATKAEIENAVRQNKSGYYKRGPYGTAWYANERPSRVDLTKDNNAVSPVIAVILMVAITVVLAATVFVLVSDIQTNSPAARIVFDQSPGNLTVVSADLGLVWADFEIVNCDTTPVGTVDAGDKISGCDGDVVIRHKPSNSLVYQGTF